MPDPGWTEIHDSEDSPNAAGTPTSGRSGFPVLVAVGALFVLGAAMLVARGGGTSGAGAVTDATLPASEASEARAPVKRIAGVAELPAGAVDHVEVAYFHRTHRCSGCINVERLTRETLDTRFADRLQSGDISLVVEDTEAPADPDLVQRYEAWGSALYLSVAKGGTAYTWRVDDVWFYVNEDQRFIDVLADQIRAIYGES